MSYTLVLIYLSPLPLEFALLLYFLFILRTRGTQMGRHSLLIISAIISFFAFVAISQLLYNSMTPIPPPPEIPNEEYYAGLGLRLTVALKAQVDAIFLFILTLSYMCVRSRE